MIAKREADEGKTRFVAIRISSRETREVVLVVRPTGLSEKAEHT